MTTTITRLTSDFNEAVARYRHADALVATLTRQVAETEETLAQLRRDRIVALAERGAARQALREEIDR